VKKWEGFPSRLGYLDMLYILRQCLQICFSPPWTIFCSNLSLVKIGPFVKGLFEQANPVNELKIVFGIDWLFDR
jgi:hypothetical protein